MSNTITDMPKVTQMLDAGWKIVVYKNSLGSYTAEAIHSQPKVMRRTRDRLVEGMRENKQFLKTMKMTAEEAVDESDFNDGYLSTDDFTPEQALTRLAYKVFGEVI